jgi:hypothetical protein
MHNFIVKRRPASYNSSKKESYKNALRASFVTYNAAQTMLGGDLYAIVYYFFRENVHLDTDNLSKPVWDCMNGLLFADDRQIKIRIAGSFDLNTYDYRDMNMSGLEENIVVELFDAFEKENHIIYVECGKLNLSMVKFNIEQI